MSDRNIPSNLRVEEWIPWGEAVRELPLRFSVNDPNWVLDNWDYKYIDARIDMRTGSVRLTAGNKLPAVETSREPVAWMCGEQLLPGPSCPGEWWTPLYAHPLPPLGDSVRDAVNGKADASAVQNVQGHGIPAEQSATRAADASSSVTRT